MFSSNHFTFANCRRISRVLVAMEELAKGDWFFKEALEQFNNADKKEQTEMAKFLLSLYEESAETGVALEELLVFSSFG